MTFQHVDTVIAFVLIITGVSLFITALNQMVSAFLGLRGTNLRWAIKTLLANVDPNLRSHAKEITEQVLHHPLISDSTFARFQTRLFGRWKLATAIKKDELTRILRLLATPASKREAESTALAWNEALGEALDELDPQAAQDLVSVAAEIKEFFPDDTAKAQGLMNVLMNSASNLTAKIDQWFDSVMARSSQRFTVQMRVWTVIFAVVLAFGLQLDSFRLFTRLSSDAELRARVIASADALTTKADELLVTSTNGSSTVYVLAMQQLIADHTNELKQFSPPAGFTTLQGGKDWLAAELKEHGLSVQKNSWTARYLDQLPQAALRSAYDNLNSVLANKLVFEILPDPYPNPIYRDWKPTGRTFWGLIASAALLSLGAPFWFNVLRTVSNLRPTLANKQEKVVGHA